ncbi:lysine--tRNA ligase [Candidatus Shapirobacteria bacterium]|nr:lysine--tRNA ligase [Candidatus Shapirobacteria bacterium]
MTDLIKIRQEKLGKLIEAGHDPYPQPNLAKRDLAATIASKKDQTVEVAGRLMLLRGHGKILFADLHDDSGKIQLFFQQKSLGTSFPLTKLFDIGDIISAKGKVITTEAGETTIDITEFQILAKNLRPLPEKWHGLTDVEERYRQRYVDLITNPESRKVFTVRTKILSTMRQFLDDNGFMEVETPILQPVYGGASAKPFVTHHNELDQDMYLRISDELYLKRLIVGGFEKVYEVSRDFRNEGVSRFHNPEFTQIEFYWAYIDYDELMKFTEKLVSHVIKTINSNYIVEFQGKSLDFTPPFKRLTFRDAILEKTKIDIDEINTEEEFFDKLKSSKLKVDTKGVIGLGALFDALYKEYVRPYLLGPVYITDYPAEMIALAKRKSDNPKKIASFQLLADGAELLKAYNELNDPKDQYDRWMDEVALEKKGAQNTMQMDDDYIRALEYGMPPTAGWGMGIDRFTQFVTNSPTIKDVILFPSMRSEEKPASLRLPASEGGTEGDAAISLGIGLASNLIVIGKITKLESHPNADKLHVLHVDIGTESLQIVCGANNIKVGDIVPVSLIGASVYGDEMVPWQVGLSKLRGVESNGMLCSTRELGLGPDHDGIYLLDKKLSQHLGEPVNKHLKK